MSNWNSRDSITIPENFSHAIGGHPLVIETLFRHGYTTIESARAFLDPAFYQPSHASEMPGISQAIPILVDAIQGGKPILVWGDFDVDGQTATTLLVSGIRLLGGKVRHYIPVRSIESHGVHPKRLKALLEVPTSLLVTCDTGISSTEAVSFANQAGIQVIITDHHV